MVNYPEIFNPRHLSDICHTRLRKPYLERVIFSEDGTSPAQVRVEFLVTDQQKFCKSSILNQAELVFIAGFIPGFFWPHFQNPTSNKNLSQRKKQGKRSCIMRHVPSSFAANVWISASQAPSKVPPLSCIGFFGRFIESLNAKLGTLASQSIPALGMSLLAPPLFNKSWYLCTYLLRPEQKAIAFPHKPMLHGWNFSLRDGLAKKRVCNM